MRHLLFILFFATGFVGFSQKGVYILENKVPKLFFDNVLSDSIVEFPIIVGDLKIILGLFQRVKFIHSNKNDSFRIDKGWWSMKDNIIHIDLGKTADFVFDLEYIEYEDDVYLRLVDNGHLYLKKK